MKFTKSLIILTLLCCLNLTFSSSSSKRVHHKAKSHSKAFNTSRFLRFLSLRNGEDLAKDPTIPDPIVVYSMKIVTYKSAQTTCPYPYQPAKSNCEGTTCDLNKGVDSQYSYLCVAKKKISELTSEENMVNTITKQINNKDCGQLNLIENSLSILKMSYDKLYLCYGKDEKIEAAPYSEIYVYHLTLTNNFPDDTDCSFYMTDQYRICFKPLPKAPKQILYSGLKLSPATKITAIGYPETITEIHNDNGSGKDTLLIKKSISTTVVNTSSWNIENKLSSKIDTKFVFAVPIFKLGSGTVTASIDFNVASSKSETKTETKVEQVDYQCSAPAGKYYKCLVTNERYSTEVPYSVIRTVISYDGAPSAEIISSTFKGVLSSSFKFERCCYKGCDELKDNLCKDFVKTGSVAVAGSNCPKIDGAVPNPPKVESEIMKLKYDPELVTDMKVIEGAKTSCPNQYKKAECYNTKKPCNLNQSAVGSDLYLCVKQEKLSQIKSKPLNMFNIAINLKECGALKIDDMDLNKGNAGSKLYVCYGTVDAKLAPFSDVVIAVKNKNIPGYECNDTNLNLKSGGIADLFICAKRDKNAPKRVELTNFVYDNANFKKSQVGAPTKVDEVMVSSGSVTKIVKVNTKVETGIKKVIDYGIAVGVMVTAGDPKLGCAMSAGITETLRRTGTTELKEATEEMESTQVDCVASEKKKIKCISSYTKYKLTVPYKFDINYYDYDDELMPSLTVTQGAGVFEGVRSTGISVRSCCLENCCTKIDANCPVIDTPCTELDKCFEEPTPKKRFYYRRK